MTPFAFTHIILGVLLLMCGRKLFWLFVAAVGFVAGAHVATVWLHHAQPLVVFLVAILFGLIGAVLARAVQKLAIALAGFFAGGYLLTVMLGLSTLHIAGREWMPFIIGGVIGAVLMVVLFDSTLIVLSSIGGAHLITSELHFRHSESFALMIALVVCGILVQSKLIGGGAKTKPE
jgi:hypothetical protein